MSPLVVLGVGLVGGLGALARFTLDSIVAGWRGRAFPYGTLAVNLSGALLLGVFAGAALSTDAYRVAGTGFVGAYTTFSTWMLESHRLNEDGQARSALLNIGVSLVLGVLVVLLGRWIGRQL